MLPTTNVSTPASLASMCRRVCRRALSQLVTIRRSKTGYTIVFKHMEGPFRGKRVQRTLPFSMTSYASILSVILCGPVYHEEGATDVALMGTIDRSTFEKFVDFCYPVFDSNLLPKCDPFPLYEEEHSHMMRLGAKYKCLPFSVHVGSSRQRRNYVRWLVDHLEDEHKHCVYASTSFGNLIEDNPSHSLGRVMHGHFENCMVPKCIFRFQPGYESICHPVLCAFSVPYVNAHVYFDSMRKNYGLTPRRKYGLLKTEKEIENSLRLQFTPANLLMNFAHTFGGTFVPLPTKRKRT